MSYGPNGIVPLFVYNSTNFTPTYAPTGKIPIDTQRAERHDSITTSGLQQSVTERIDRVLTLTFKNIPESDLIAWDEFIAWAIQGQQFTYAPDSTEPGTYNTYYLVNMDVPFKWVSFQNYSTTLNLRRVLTAEIGS
jgi:hypothetical protein